MHAGVFMGGVWAAFGVLVKQDANIYRPNLLGMLANLANLLLICVFPPGTGRGAGGPGAVASSSRSTMKKMD